MNITAKLSGIMREGHRLPAILNRAVEIIAHEMGVDACSILLLESQDQRLHLLATHGLDKAALGKVSLAVREGLVGQVVADRRPLAVEHAASHPGYRYVPETREERFQSFLGVPLMLRGEALGALVIQTAQRRPYSDEEIQDLLAASAQLVGVIANARLFESLGRGEHPPRHPAPRRPPAAAAGERVLQGTPASPGIAIGVAVFRGRDDARLDESPASRGPPVEIERLRDALARTCDDVHHIQRAAAREADEEHALIFSSHLLLLNDPALLGRIESAIADGLAAAAAVHRTLAEMAGQLALATDPYLQDRAEDIHDLRSRLLDHLLGTGAQTELAGHIVVARRVLPSLVVEIKAQRARGLITETGGPTSHGVLLARSLGIPAVTGVSDLGALQLAAGPLILDGSAGVVVIDGHAATLRRYAHMLHDLQRLRSAHHRYRDQPARSADGVRVHLQANVSIGADLVRARESGAEGIGLYRTEFPFILREQFPTREEQVRIYRRAYETFPEGEIRFRVLDLGADKFIPSGAVSAGRNPFHGYRSLRVLFDYPHVLRDQIQALALAAERRPLSILLPMVSSLEELRRTKALIAQSLAELDEPEAQRAPRIGVMIEVPSAVELAGDLARESDFFSIGTNDLLQYALVVDREDPRMASPDDVYHPAILRMIQRAVRAAREAGKPIGVCGEMAAMPTLAPLLLAMGVDSLSVAAPAIPELKRALGRVALGPLAAAVGELLALPDAASIREALRGYLPSQHPAPCGARAQA